MIKPNWDVFKAKFSENPQNNFEWLCYLLFCNEFGKKHGIFRYKNQSAIETTPIKDNDNTVAWQAKFYESSLSNYKKELEDTIIKTKRDYPEVNKLYIYSNQEWGQNKGQKPQGIIDIEKQATELEIHLEWKLASFFESEFVTVENKIITKHFFTLEKSIFSIMEELQRHSKNILSHINTEISFQQQRFEIVREKEVDQLTSDPNQVFIISGIGGVGKTVVVKKAFENLKDKIPFYVFKATEFELRSISDFFSNFNFYDFVKSHSGIEGKTIVIDSAEKLLDLRNIDPFKEFLTAIVEDDWKVIFTTRDAYLRDLNYQFFEIYNIVPKNIGIRCLELEELNTISGENNFSLPKDDKILELIRNPFYLNEYLKYYIDEDEMKYAEFKLKLWEQRIKRSKPEREKCFIEFASKRTDTGQFFVNVSPDLSIYCDELMKDGMLGYEEPGYFITHDIYEEWALEKIINREFANRSGEANFFKVLGDSLPIRRSLRNWISEKLLLEEHEIVRFIEDVIENDDIESFWKDELFVSILLSDYSKIFFQVFKSKLLSNECELLKRLTFILRISCKEVDDEFFKQLGIKQVDLWTLECVLTKPKGQGWKALIEFAYQNLDEIGVENINFILPLIKDWNDKVVSGTTTRFASLIALRFYRWIIDKDVYYSREDKKEVLFKTIINGSGEVKDELKEIFTDILSNKWKNYRDPYYDFSRYILTKIEAMSICEVLPDEVIELADLFWTYTPSKRQSMYGLRDEIEHSFGLERYVGNYHPSSAYQSPIYWLLKISPRKTINFILRFANKSIKTYIKSTHALKYDSINEIEIELSNGRIKKQYISSCIWNLYRGTGSPVTPYLLQSLHMALEKYLLEIAKHIESKVLENWLTYLLEYSDSASISSVVTSIVLAYPERTFNTAKILFNTKEFIIYDTKRLVFEHSAKSLYSIGQLMGTGNNSFYDKERIKTCDDKHRKESLENLFLKYQIFAMNGTSEDEAKKRQKILWKILDRYYSRLPIKDEQSEDDKIWRLFLARMDCRKMDIKAEETADGILFQFEPEIEPEINNFREKNQKAQNEQMKHIPLKQWAELKFKNDESYKQYEKFENNSKLALEEVKEILDKLDTIETPKLVNAVRNEDEQFHLFNYSTPSKVCTVLIHHSSDDLSEEDKELCKDVLISTVIASVQTNYFYQLDDGVQEAIISLPKLIELFPEEIETIKCLLLLTLFKEESVGGLLATERFSIFPMMAIHKLWEDEFDHAHSLLLGYLFLKSKYEELIDLIQKENFEAGNYEVDYNNLLDRFLNENKINLTRMVENKLCVSEAGDIQSKDISLLATAFRLMPVKLENKEHFTISHEIISLYAKVLTQDRDDKIDYCVRDEFYKKFAYVVLNAEKSDASKLIRPFVDNFNSSKPIAELLQELVLAEDHLNKYDNFWFVWNSFKEKVMKVAKDGKRYSSDVVMSYLFARTPWKKSTKAWHSLRAENTRFFKDVADQIGQYPSTLYSISKLLNDIGSQFIDEGIIWISNMLSKNADYKKLKLKTNTLYYLENIVKKYAYMEREKIKRSKQLRQRMLVILNFLIEKGSCIGYILRERII